eukprot:m.390287 g.390287  ORF g.390287 m.390287 type:complete len:361 (+) comp56341_c0_seq3:1887-2969(+)
MRPSFPPSLGETFISTPHYHMRRPANDTSFPPHNTIGSIINPCLSVRELAQLEVQERRLRSVLELGELVDGSGQLRNVPHKLRCSSALGAIHDLAVILVDRNRQCLVHHRNRHAQVRLNIAQILNFVVPDGTTALLLELDVRARLALAGTAVVPHFLKRGPGKRDGQPHAVCTPNAANPVHVVLLFVRNVEVDDKWNALHVNSTRCHVRANQESHVTLLEASEIVPALIDRAIAVHTCAGVLGNHRTPSTATLKKKVLDVVAVHFRPTEDDGLIHFVLVNCLQEILVLEDLDGLGHCLSRCGVGEIVTVVNAIHSNALALLIPPVVLGRVNKADAMMDCVGNAVLALQVHPGWEMHDFVC